ncbi:MAG: methyltransferase domain-containing protein [Pyrobaculum sp.]
MSVARLRVVKARSPFTRARVPALFGQVDFQGALVVDVGAGYGAKAEYAVRRGARCAVLIDVDVDVLRGRGGPHFDSVAADAHMLPLRGCSADVVVFWNVLQFLQDEDKALGEVARVSRRYVLLSVYKTARGRWYTWGQFLSWQTDWGSPSTLDAEAHSTKRS